jgi:hypothetical protein
MRPRGAIEEHGIGAVDGQVKGADDCLPILEGDMPAMNRRSLRLLQRLASISLGGLGDGVVPVAELELNGVANLGLYHVGYKQVLRTTDYDGDDLARWSLALEPML